MSEHGERIAERYGVTRSAEWPSAVRAHLARHPTCVACRHPGARVEVHHIFPFHFCVALGRPDLTTCLPSNKCHRRVPSHETRAVAMSVIA